MTQLEFLKSIFLLLGITCQVDAYRPRPYLATGNKLLENIPIAKNWSNKLDLAAPLGRQPERSLGYRLGDFGQTNLLEWTKDDSVTPGYGNGELLITDEILPAKYTMATLPFAATERSPKMAGLLRILNYKSSGITVVPPKYTVVVAKPRLTLHAPPPLSSIKMAGVSITTSASYFDSTGLGLMLNKTVLGGYWQP